MEPTELEPSGISGLDPSSPADLAPGHRSPARGAPPTGSRDLRLSLAVAAGYLVFWPLVHLVPSAALPVVAVTTLLSLLLVLLFTVFLARSMRTPRRAGISLSLSALLILPSIAAPLLVRLSPAWAGWTSLLPMWRGYFHLLVAVNGLRTLGLIWLAASLGAALAGLVREFKLLLPMGVALAMVDLYSVLGGGLVATAVSGTNRLAQTAMSALTVQLPTTQPRGGAAPFPLLIGFADFLFVGLFFACFTRFGVPARRTFYLLFATLYLYMAAVFLFGIPLPALVPIAVVVIGANLRRFRYERSEAFALLYAGLLLAGALGYLVFRSKGG